MNIVDLDDELKPVFCMCLEDWSEEVKEGGDHRARWTEKMLSRGLRAKLAKDDKGVVGGMIQYVPIEYSPAEGKDSYFMHCIWIHGHKQDRGNFQKKGMGKALLKAAEEDAKARGAKGMAAWGVSLPFWMRASWFKKQGYEKVDKEGIMVLMWKPFRDDALPPKWIRQKKIPEPLEGKVLVTSFISGWCSAGSIVHERARRACAELGDKIVFRAVDTLNRDTFLEWGMMDALFVDDKEVQTGPPPSYEKIKKIIGKKVKKLG